MENGKVLTESYQTVFILFMTGLSTWWTIQENLGAGRLTGAAVHPQYGI